MPLNAYDYKELSETGLSPRALQVLERIITPLSSGYAQLSSGAVTIADTSITSTSIVKVHRRSVGSNPGSLYVSALTPNTGFTITSSNGSDNGNIYYEITSYSTPLYTTESALTAIAGAGAVANVASSVQFSAKVAGAGALTAAAVQTIKVSAGTTAVGAGTLAAYGFSHG